MNKKIILSLLVGFSLVALLAIMTITNSWTNVAQHLGLSKTNFEIEKGCYTDAECSPSQVCDCPSSSPTGNCDRAGVCKPRPEIALNETETGLKSNLNSCQYMTDIRAIPTGYHPASVQWRQGSPEGDLVCISRTQGKEFQVVNWNNFPLPEGYYILY